MSGLASAIGAPDTWPLSPEQRTAAGTAQALALTVEIAGALDEAVLRRSLAEVAARHDLLCAAFVNAPGFVGLRLLPLDAPAEIGWTVRDLRASPAPDAEMEDDLGALRATTFDLVRGGTLRAALWRLGNARWRLALVASPLVTDEGGLALVVRALRDAHAAGGDAAAPDEVATYGQYAEWRQDMETDEDADQGRCYWREHLVGSDAVAALWLPYRSAAEAPSRPASLSAAIDPAVAARVAALAAEPGPDGAAAVLQAAWWALVARISGRTELVAGWRHDCRRDYEIFGETFGPFEKTFPLQLAPDPSESFTAFAARLEELLVEHRGWQEHLPPETVGLRPAIGFGLMELDAGKWPRVALDGADLFELELRPELGGDGNLQKLTIAYDAARYDEAAVEILLEQMATLLAHLPDVADQPIGALSPVGPAERKRLLTFDRSEAVPQGREPILAAVLRFAQETPNAPALKGGDVSLDYAELASRIDRLGRWLVGRRIGPESIVALDMPRSVDMVTALLGVWRAGGAYLPLDPSWPEARRRRLCADAGVALALSADDVASALSGPDAGEPIEDRSDVSGRAAYVLFTSGSTGEPKAVVVEHGQLANYVAAARDALGLAERRRFALTSTAAADLGNTMLFGALAQGACLVVADDAQTRDGAAFAAVLRDERIDCAKLTPSHLAALLEGDRPAAPATLVLGGEPTPAALVARVLEIAPDCRVLNHYGPTETTVGVLVHAYDPAGSALDARGLPLTRVLDGNAVHVLDGAGGLAPTGAAGALHVGGAQLCRGYLGQDGAGFVADPFHAGGKLYPTGDLARRRPDGGLDIIGRADRQVKIRGYRVEPGEIEAVLAALGGVRQAAVVARRPGDGQDAALVAFVTLSGEAADAGGLRAALADRLPEPMVPERVVVLGAMPLLPNGKIDRGRLHAAEAELGAEAVAPRDALETVLRNVAAELLARSPETLGVTDDFFEVGGHSLLVIKFVARIRKLFSLDVPPGIVFDHPSIAALAQALRAQTSGGRLDEVAALRLKLDSLSPEERSALLHQAAH